MVYRLTVTCGMAVFPAAGEKAGSTSSNNELDTPGMDVNPATGLPCVTRS